MFRALAIGDPNGERDQLKYGEIGHVPIPRARRPT